MKRVLIGTVVGGVVLFVWQFAAWMFLGIHDLDPEPLLANEAEVVSALEGTKRGVYWIPGIKMEHHKDAESAEHKAWEKKHEAGPRVFLNYDPAGASPMSPKVMAVGAVINLLMVLVIALMLKAAALHGVIGRFFFVAGFGVFLALAADLQNWNWMNYPAGWTRGGVIDHVVGMALVGIVLAVIVKPADYSPLPE